MGEDDLTVREIEVLQELRMGHRNKETAFRLSISETTVNFHVRNLAQKLRANDRVEIEGILNSERLFDLRTGLGGLTIHAFLAKVRGHNF
jgi:DNA-binding NarL/FixJ family response regulator